MVMAARRVSLATILFLAFGISTAHAAAAGAQASGGAKALRRTADGKPDFQGIWQVQNNKAAADLQTSGAVAGNAIPYLPEAAAKKLENSKNRQTADPLNKCYMPGVPRIMYMEYPFQIFQTPEHVAMTFEWSQVHRLIYMNSKKPLHGGLDFWMGD